MFLAPGNGVIDEFFTLGDQASGGEVQAGDGDPGQSRSQDVQDHQVLGQGKGVLDIAQDPLCHRQDEQSGGGKTDRTSGAGAVSTGAVSGAVVDERTVARSPSRRVSS